MSINTAHLQKLNNRESKTSKIFLKMMNLFSGKPDIIQLGIGGYSSSGKTVLIDALFSFFDNMAIPGYMPQNDYGTLTEDFDGLPVYEKHGDLRRKVSNYFHHDNKTEDKGIWHENTHCAKLSFAGKEAIILIRNIPGEMFELYCRQSNNNSDSLKTQFKTFISKNGKDKKLLSNLFKFKIKGKDQDKSKIIEEIINKIRSDFFSFIDLNGTYSAQQETILKIEKNFFSFLFYYTSDYNIYCIKSKGLIDDERKNINDNIFGNDKNKFILCYTQFDRILIEKTLPEIITNNQAKELTVKGKLANHFFEAIGIKKNESNNNTKTVNEMERYWLVMEMLYEDIAKQQYKYINKVDWDGIKSVTPKHNFNWFFSSVAYNFKKKKFLNFENQSNVANGNNGDTIWNLENNNERTPIGVLEILLFILKRKGFKESNWKLALPNSYDYKTIRKKIGIK